MKIDVTGKRAGSKLQIDGQKYWCFQEVPFEREDGKPTRLLAWEAECAEPGCNAEFWCLTPHVGKSYFSRRCCDHARPGVPVKPRGKGHISAKKRALLDRLAELETALATANAKIEALERGK